ncbi:MAG: M61 family metallopeptidase [Granulosicoccus sp.]
MTIDYTVSISQADAHLVDMCLHISKPDQSGQILRLPNWIPGSYMIRDFSRNIVTISALSGSAEVVLEKLDKSTWRAPAQLTDLTVTYQVYAWDLSVRAAHVDRTHAFLNGTSIFLSVDGQEDEPVSVVFERPEHDSPGAFKLATTLPAAAVDSTGFGHYVAADYDELIDHPIEQGTFKQLDFEACGVRHEIVLTGACHFDEERVVRDLTTICEYQIRFFGEPAPMDRYVFMVMVVDQGYGGLEHRASTALMITRENLPVVGDDKVSDQYLDFLGLCSHEYFHTWNVKRIKPARFVPYELAAESYTELLWFFEGMTSYYDDLVLVRTGLIDKERYAGLLSKTLTRVERGAGRLTQSVTDSSFDAWHKFYKQDENAPNAIVSYYAKGALIALCLDALLRRASSNAASLDTLMKTLWQRWLDSAKGVAEDEPQQIATEIAGYDLSEFFNDVLYSTKDLPVAQSLQHLGMNLQWQARVSSADMGGHVVSDKESDQSPSKDTVKPQPWLGANIKDAPGGVVLSQTLRGGPAEKAGLAAGDLLIAINSLSVSKQDVDNHLLRYAGLGDVPIHYFRLGQLHESRLSIESPPIDTAVLSFVDSTASSLWLNESSLAELSSDATESGIPL